MDVNQSAVIIIANAGDSRSSCLEALAAAGERNYQEAERLLKDAEEKLLIAHNEHTNLLVSDARGESVELTLLMVHASDHIANAETVHDLTEQMIHILEERDNV